VVFVFVAVAAVAAVILWFTALKYFNAQHVATMLTQALQEAFNRPVALESIKLVSFNAVEIKNLKIIDNSTDIYNEFISAGSIIIRYDLLPLREGRIVIDEIIINNPSISIIRDKNGIFNTADLKAAGSRADKRRTGNKNTVGAAILPPDVICKGASSCPTPSPPSPRPTRPAA